MNGAKFQSYACSIEHDLRAEYNCDRMGIGGIANSDHVRGGGLYHCLAMVLVKYYYGENKKNIDDFIENIWDIDGKKMEDIGLEKVEEVLKKYEQVYKTVKQKS